MRLLLLHVPGPTSFDDVRTVDGQILGNYKEACLLHGLLTDDTEWHKALLEATSFRMPFQLRSFFATICLYCEPTDPLSLWNRRKEALAEDYRQTHNVPAAEKMALCQIQAILQQHGLSCSDFGQPNTDHIV